MLTILDHQMEALGAAALESLEERMTADVRSRLADAAAMDPRAVLSRVRDRIARARAAGHTDEPAVRRYVRESFHFDPPPEPPAPPTPAERRAEARSDGSSPQRPRQVASPVQPCMGWLEIELVDETGTMLADRDFELELPDGTRRPAMTDARGRYHVFGIDPGNCSVLFPEQVRKL